MDNEVTKLYENAGVKKQYDYIVIKKNYNGKIGYTKRAVLEKVEQFKNKTLRIIDVSPFYPEFTAEKQLELIKWLLTKVIDTEHIHLEFSDRTFKFLIHSVACSGDDCDTLENALCSYINNLWQDLTEEEKAEIKRILE